MRPKHNFSFRNKKSTLIPLTSIMHCDPIGFTATIESSFHSRGFNKWMDKKKTGTT